jgi:predicted porin
MNKKLLAVAIGAALTAPMYAANAAVTIGGQAHISADYVDQFYGLTTDSHKVWNVSSNVSNIFVKADEDLGGGLKAVFFLQEYFRLDNQYGAAPTTNTGASNRMFDAPAYAGLSSSTFGTVLLGTQDGPAKLVGRHVDLFGNMIGDSRYLGEDNTRLSNAITYTTPNFGGFSAVVGHSTNTDNGVNTTTGGQLSGNTLGLKFAQGPVAVEAAYLVKVNQADTGLTYADNKIINLGASFKIAGARIVAYYQNAKANGNVDGTDTDTYGVGASYSFGNETVKAQYYNLTKKATAAADISSNIIAIGYDHHFSKTFTGYAAVASASNDAGGTVSVAGGIGHGDTVTLPAGNPTGEGNSALSLGIIYNF